MPESAPKWTRQPEKRPAQIVAAALDVFSARGYQGATMEEVAERCGITKGTIYRYFSNKEDLLVETLRAHAARLLKLLPELRIVPGDDLDVLLRRLARQYLDVLMSPEMVKVTQLVIAEVNHLPRIRELYQREMVPQANLRLAGILQTGMDLGLLRPLDPVITARALLGMFAVFPVTQELFGARGVTPMTMDDIADTIVTVFFRGLLASP